MSLNTLINIDKKDNLIVIIPEGDMDIYSSTQFKDLVLDSYNEEKMDLLINGEKLEYVDSTGLGALIGILKRVKEDDKKIYLSNIKPNIRKLFDITELDKLFIIRSENDE